MDGDKRTNAKGPKFDRGTCSVVYFWEYPMFGGLKGTPKGIQLFSRNPINATHTHMYVQSSCEMVRLSQVIKGRVPHLLLATPTATPERWAKTGMLRPCHMGVDQKDLGNHPKMTFTTKWEKLPMVILGPGILINPHISNLLARYTAC